MVFLPWLTPLNTPGVLVCKLSFVIWNSRRKLSNCVSTTCQCRLCDLNEHTRHECVWYLSCVIFAEPGTISFLEIIFCRLVTNLVPHPSASLQTGHVKVKLCDHNNYWYCDHDKSAIKLRITDSCLCYDLA